MTGRAPCEHPDFEVLVNFARIDEGEGLLGLMTEVSARCKECGEPVRFRAATAGLSWVAPAVSVDAKTIHLPAYFESDPALGVDLVGYTVAKASAPDPRSN